MHKRKCQESRKNCEMFKLLEALSREEKKSNDKKRIQHAFLLKMLEAKHETQYVVSRKHTKHHVKGEEQVT